MSDKILKNIFNNLENSLRSEMRIQIDHNLEDGKYREYLMERLLHKILPAKYAIRNGFIVDSDNNKSKEMDIIIYDKSYVPPFLDETYTLVPIEAVIAVLQVKTTLTRDSLQSAVENLNSIDDLTAKIGGEITSADGARILREVRFICPYKIIISYKNKVGKEYDYLTEMETIDIIYTVESEGKHKGNLFIKNKKREGVVNLNKSELQDNQKSDDIKEFDENKLCIFVLTLLEKMKLINNGIIINYEEYIKGVI